MLLYYLQLPVIVAQLNVEIADYFRRVHRRALDRTPGPAKLGDALMMPGNKHAGGCAKRRGDEILLLMQGKILVDLEA
jgi:hypothetical protein